MKCWSWVGAVTGRFYFSFNASLYCGFFLTRCIYYFIFLKYIYKNLVLTIGLKKALIKELFARLVTFASLGL